MRVPRPSRLSRKSGSGRCRIVRLGTWRRFGPSLCGLAWMGCSTSTGPTQPDLRVETELVLSRPLGGPEEFPPAAVEVAAGTVRITIAEWFPSQGFVLADPQVQFRAPAAVGSLGLMSLNMETRETTGVGLVWRKDHRISIRDVPPGWYRLILLRFDPGIRRDLHPFGNPRVPVDTNVTVP
jgi:hypothetical protein